MTTSDSILKWLEENKEWFKVSVISKKANIDKGNLSKFIKAKSIPEKHLIPIMEVIIPFGFTLNQLIVENNKPENKAKIENERNPVKPEKETKSNMPDPKDKAAYLRWLRTN